MNSVIPITKPCHLLIVEDEDFVATGILRKLKRLGFEHCDRVSSGEEALEYVRQTRPDLVVMDMGLGGKLDGVETAQALRDQYKMPSVFLTGNSSYGMLQKAKLTHPLGYLIKPPEDDDLCRTLELALQNARMEQALQASELALQELNRHLEQRVDERTKELVGAKEKIEATLREKEVLFQEVHHRVKNNLQIISSLLRMQSETVHHEKAIDALRESQARVKSMALIHECLYQSKELSEVSFKNYLLKLAQSLKTLYGIAPNGMPIFELKIDDIQMDLDTAIPCGLIVTEVITNALKHAFKDRDKGSLRIDFRTNNAGGALLEIRDDGIGIADDAFTASETGGMGYKIITALCKQIQANGSYHRNAEGGTTFTLSIPKLSSASVTRVA